MAALGGFFVGPVFVNAADPLEQILKSKYLNQLDAKSVKYEKKVTWLEKGSNLYKLFHTNSPQESLIQWLTIDPKLGEPEVLKSFREGEWLGFDGRTPRGLNLRVRIPHPRVQDSAELGLLESFRDFHPLPVELSYSEATEILTFPAELQQYKSGLCQLVVHIAVGGVVELSQESCEDITLLSHAARGLNIKRLSNKLKT